MKQYITSLLMLSFSFAITAENYPSGKDILDRVDQNMNAKTRVVHSSMEIQGNRGSRTLEVKTWSEGDSKAFSEYLAPAREKGTKMLKLDDQLWIYSPSADRIIQISGHMLRQSVMGSDLSYEDMMDDAALLERYQAEVTGEEEIRERACWILELTAIVPEVNYHKQILSIDQERYIPLQADYYSKSDKLLKRISFDNAEQIDGRWYPKTMLYKDMLKEGKGTLMNILSLEIDKTIPSTVFNKGNLR
ncbi:MAG: outer membrane lipoprotein-sorting protein [Bacteroidales bacterium]|nr:outer membrane lipoprotein-sorting protein [Bacteroidales bacterium]